MRAVVLSAPESPSLEEVPDPTPMPGEVVVEVEACGICGTDLHIYDGHFAPTEYPLIPGHEFSGRIAAIGDGVRNLPEGARVAVDPSLFCGHCTYCRRGRGNLCVNWNATGDTVDGAFAEYVSTPADNVYLVGDDMSAPQAAMIEPVSCAVHAMDRLRVLPGSDVLLYGAGTMGLILGQLLRRAGAQRLHVVDLQSERLPLARDLMADEAATGADELDAVPDAGYDLVVDATGAIPAIEDGFARVRRGGTMLIFGVADAEKTAALSPFRIYNDEINVIGSMAVLHSFGKARDLLQEGVIEVDPLITSVRPLEEYEDAIAAVRRGEGIKTHLSPGSTG